MAVDPTSIAGKGGGIGSGGTPGTSAEPWNPAAKLYQNIGGLGIMGQAGPSSMPPGPQQPFGGSASNKGGAIPAFSAQATDDPNAGLPSQVVNILRGNGIARGMGVTPAQVADANKNNPYSRDAADVEEGIYGKDRANVLAYAGSIANNQNVPPDVQASIDKLKKAGVYSPVDLSGYGKTS